MPVTSAASSIKAGTVAFFAASTAPAGWIKANGATISRSSYASLFAAIGTTYGAGDGTTTFAIPDLRGEFLRGLDDGRGVDSGRGIGTAQGSQMQSHTHNQTTIGPAGSTIYSPLQQWVEAYNTYATSAAGGTSNGSENRPRNIAMLACIKF